MSGNAGSQNCGCGMGEDMSLGCFDFRIRRCGGGVGNSGGTVALEYVRGKISSTNLPAATYKILTPDSATLQGKTEFVDGDKFVADKSGLYSITLNTFIVSVVQIISVITVMKNGETNYSYSPLFSVSQVPGIGFPNLNCEIWLEEGDYVTL